MPESLGDGDIVLGPGNGLTGDTCLACQGVLDREHARDPHAATVSDVKLATFGDDPGCATTYAKDGKHGRLIERVHGRSDVFVLCLGSVKELDPACDAVIRSLRPREP